VVAGLRKTKLEGSARVVSAFTFAAAVCNLARALNLIGTTA
jgi:hypothetical protein